MFSPSFAPPTEKSFPHLWATVMLTAIAVGNQCFLIDVNKQYMLLSDNNANVNC